MTELPLSTVCNYYGMYDILQTSVACGAHQLAAAVHVRVRQASVLVVGTMMNASRQAALCSSGLLHAAPIDGVCYIPLQPNVPLDAQPAVDALLAKATDFLRATADGLAEFRPQLHEVSNAGTCLAALSLVARADASMQRLCIAIWCCNILRFRSHLLAPVSHCGHQRVLALCLHDPASCAHIVICLSDCFRRHTETGESE